MSGSFQILEAGDKAQSFVWNSLVNGFFGSEPMLRPEYAALFAAEGDAPFCFAQRFAGGVMIYPFILRRAGGEFCDITTPYGYGGPTLAGKATLDETEGFWELAGQWLRGRNAVSEFIRFSLFTGQETGYPGELAVTARNVVCNLGRNIETIWMDFEHKVRKNVNRARTLGVTVETDTTGERLDDFLTIYTATLDRRGAQPSYYFDRAFFQRIHGLAGGFLYFFACFGGKPVSAELVLISDDNIYSYLGGTLDEFYCCRPNDFLKYHIIRWGVEHGRRNFILGGGYHDDDGIFCYKKSFAPQGIVPYCTGRRVLLSDDYAALSQARERQAAAAGNVLDHTFFPLYRAPEVTA